MKLYLTRLLYSNGNVSVICSYYIFYAMKSNNLHKGFNTHICDNIYRLCMPAAIDQTQGEGCGNIPDLFLRLSSLCLQ